MKKLLVATLLAFGTVTFAQQERDSNSPAQAEPRDPVATIIDAFRIHEIVALSEGRHGNVQGHQFRLALIRDPRFPTVVDDIVVETGNALYQPVMDRFIAGEDVTHESLRRVWQNTTQPFGTFDIPIYEQFFRAVRELNTSLPPTRRLRVLLGDPPLDWDRVTPDDLGEWNRAMAQRDTHPTDVIRREVLARGRRALVIYGGMHLQRRNLSFNYEPDDPLHTIVPVLERSGARVFSVWTNTYVDLQKLQPDVARWRTPTLALTRGTTLGAVDFTFYYPFDDKRVTERDGNLVPVPRDQWRTFRMEDQFDAVLYIGAPSHISDTELPRSLCDLPGYLEMRLSRYAVLDAPPSLTEGLKQFCSSK